MNQILSAFTPVSTLQGIQKTTTFKLTRSSLNCAVIKTLIGGDIKTEKNKEYVCYKQNCTYMRWERFNCESTRGTWTRLALGEKKRQSRIKFSVIMEILLMSFILTLCERTETFCSNKKANWIHFKRETKHIEERMLKGNLVMSSKIPIQMLCHN